MLLSTHGGMWLDSTFYCTAPVLDEYFKYPLWSIKRPDYFHASVAAGYFANYSLACDEDHRWIFKTILDFVLEFWKNNDIMTDYLFLDYLIVLAQKYDVRIKKVFEQIISNNPNCDELFKVLEKPYDQLHWKKIQENTYLFKLTWKKSFSTKEGITTFYDELINDRL